MFERGVDASVIVNERGRILLPTVDCYDDGRSALFGAAQFGSNDAFDARLLYGGDLNAGGRPTESRFYLSRRRRRRRR